MKINIFQIIDDYKFNLVINKKGKNTAKSSNDEVAQLEKELADLKKKYKD